MSWKSNPVQLNDVRGSRFVVVVVVVDGRGRGREGWIEVGVERGAGDADVRALRLLDWPSDIEVVVVGGMAGREGAEEEDIDASKGGLLLS